VPVTARRMGLRARGQLYIANGTSVVRLTPGAASPPTATVFTDAVAGANGLAFDAVATFGSPTAAPARAGSGGSARTGSRG
jgi:hypothetical protein